MVRRPRQLPEPTSAARWVLFMPSIPAKPASVRVKVWRRLQGLGAVSVKNSVYVLPASDQAREDFQWLLREIEHGGGEGMVCEASLVDGLSDQEVRGLQTSLVIDRETAARVGLGPKQIDSALKAKEAEIMEV